MINNYTASGPTLPRHCLPQNRIPKEHPSTFPPSQTNISMFCSQRTLYATLSYPSQPTPPNWHTPLGKGDLIPRMGASTNLKSTYTSLLSRTSWSLTPCPTHSSSHCSCNFIPQKDIVIPYMAQTRHLLNS